MLGLLLLDAAGASFVRAQAPLANAPAAVPLDAVSTPLRPPPSGAEQLAGRPAAIAAALAAQPDVPLSLLRPQDPQAFAASLPRCWWARQAPLVGQSLVTYDCRIRAPGLDATAAPLPARPLPDSYIRGSPGSTSGLLAGLAPLVVPGQPMEGQAPVLAVSPGQHARLERLTLVNTTLGAPWDPRGALSPAWLDTSRAASLWLVDTLVLTSDTVLEQYTAFMLALRPAGCGPAARFYTDNRTFLHLNEWTAPSGARATNVGVLLVGAGDSQLRQPLAGVPLDPPAPVVLSATNDTLAPLLRRYAGVETPEPLLVYIGGNVTLGGGGGGGSDLGGAVPPASRGGITIARPVILVGRALDPTSIDFRLRAGQLVASGPFANLTLDSLLLENLGYGDAAAAATARGADLRSVLTLWAFSFDRGQPRLTLRNCTAVVPRAEALRAVYWSSLFEAGAPSADWMGSEAGVTAYKVRPGPGDVVTILDLRAGGTAYEDVLLADRNRVAPQLPLPAPDARGAAPQGPGLPWRVQGLQAVRGAGELRAALAGPVAPGGGGGESVLLLTARTTSLAPGSAPGWPPPGGARVPRATVIAGVSQGQTAVDLGARGSGGGGGGGGSGAAAPLLRLPASARAAFLELRFLTLTGLGPAAGDPVVAYKASEGGAQNTMPASNTTRPSGNSSVSGAHRDGAASGRRLLSDAGPSAGAPPSSGSQLGPAPATPSSALEGEAPAARCWAMLLWAFARDYDREEGGALYVRSAELVLPPEEYSALTALAQAAPSFDLAPSGSSRRLRFSNVSLQADARSILVGAARGFNMAWSNVTLTPADAATLTPAGPAGAACAWPAPAATRPAGAAPGPAAGGGGAAQMLAVALPLALGLPALAAVAWALAARARRRRQARLGPAPAGRDAKALPDDDPAAAAAAQRHPRHQQQSIGGVAAGKALEVVVGRRHPGGAVAAGDLESPRKLGALGEHDSGFRRLSAAIGAISVDLHHRRLVASLAGPGGGGHAARARHGSGSSSLAGCDLEAGAGTSHDHASGGHSRASRDAAATPSSGGSAANGGAGAAGQGGALQPPASLLLHELLGRGTFGQVWRATWRGSVAAVKIMTLPLDGDQEGGCGGGGEEGGGARQGGLLERMAVKEAAISASVRHPNIVQVFTYMIKPVTVEDLETAAERGFRAATTPPPQLPPPHHQLAGQGVANPSQGSAAAAAAAAAVVAWDLRLVMEYCELGSLRAALDSGLLRSTVTGATHLGVAVGIAHHIACAMVHLHSEGILHGDLKANNVLLRAAPDGVHVPLPPAPPTPPTPPTPAAGGATGGSAGSRGRSDHASAEQRLTAALGPGSGVMAKVADFGLSHTLSPTDTHISDMHAGTLTHMSPELLVRGRVSKASDVYAYGILLWELATGGKAFAGMPRALIGHEVTAKRRRPAWPASLRPPSSPFGVVSGENAGAEGRVRRGLVDLAERCWAHDPRHRPEFVEVLAALVAMMGLMDQEQPSGAAVEYAGAGPSAPGSGAGAGSSGAGGARRGARLAGSSVGRIASEVMGWFDMRR